MELGLLPYDGFSIAAVKQRRTIFEATSRTIALVLQDNTSFERKRGTLFGLHQLLNLYK